MHCNVVVYDSPPLEGWRKFGRIFDGVVFINVFVFFLQVQESSFQLSDCFLFMLCLEGL